MFRYKMIAEQLEQCNPKHMLPVNSAYNLTVQSLACNNCHISLNPFVYSMYVFTWLLELITIQNRYINPLGKVTQCCSKQCRILY